MIVPTKIVCRFAPSPTGMLHIGGARTALFNWLFARHSGGAYRLRIEDTDRARSTEEACAAVLEDLAWLGLAHDGEVVHQSARLDRHREVAERLLESGHAYRCWCTPEELQRMREEARAAGRTMGYNGFWRDRDPCLAPRGVEPVVRVRMPRTGQSVIEDAILGSITVENTTLDDFILLRADGSPTYMLSVVVDDHDMGITHVIRGQDHTTNAFRQQALAEACGWASPCFGHIPLIHGPDGGKLSKRHGAEGVGTYREQGYLPEALCNYLARLGWSHGDAEIFSMEQAVAWFSLSKVGRSPARFDAAKLEALNAHVLRHADNARLVALVSEASAADRVRLERGMDSLKQRARTLVDLAASARFLSTPPRWPLTDPKAQKAWSKLEDRDGTLAQLQEVLGAHEGAWDEESLEAMLRALDVPLGQLASVLRVALTGQGVSIGVFEIVALLGQDEVLRRLEVARQHLS